MIQSHALRLMLHRRSPHPRVLELVHNALMQPVAEVPHGGRLCMENNGLFIVGNLTLRLRVDANHLAVLPDSLQKLVQVPLSTCAHGDTVLQLLVSITNFAYFCQNVELLDGDLVDFVEDVQAGHVDAVSFNDIDQIVHRGVAADGDVCIVDLVFVEDGGDDVCVQLAVL